MGKRVLAFVAAWALTYVLAVTSATQGVLGWLESLGRVIPFGERLGAIGHDIAGMLASYGSLLLIAMAIAFAVVALIVRRSPNLRLAGYLVGGFVAVIAIHLTLRLVFSMNPVWATGTPWGLLVQGLCGLAGGYLFVRLNRPAAA